MTLATAILNILDTAPRPITAEIILDFLPGFYDGPELKPGDKSHKSHGTYFSPANREAQLTTVLAALERLQAVDEVLVIPHHHLGRLWKITANGKAAIA